MRYRLCQRINHIALAVFYATCCSGDGTTPVFQKYNPLLHGGAAADMVDEGGAQADAAKKGQVQLLT